MVTRVTLKLQKRYPFITVKQLLKDLAGSGCTLKK